MCILVYGPSILPPELSLITSSPTCLLFKSYSSYFLNISAFKPHSCLTTATILDQDTTFSKLNSVSNLSTVSILAPLMHSPQSSLVKFVKPKLYHISHLLKRILTEVRMK